MNTRIPSSTAPSRTAIIGAGFGGLGMAYALRKAGLDNILLLGEAAGLGRPWREEDTKGEEEKVCRGKR